MRFVTALALASLAAAQTPGPPAVITILAPSNFVTAGETQQLTAVVADSAGQARSGDVIRWSVAPFALGSVSDAGLFTPATLGTARIIAAVGSLQNEFRVVVTPKSIRVSAPSKLVVGESTSLKAEALDVRGRVVPNVTFTWAVHNALGFTTEAASIDATGKLEARATGRVRITASFPYTGVPSWAMPRVSGTALVDLAIVETYTFRRVFVAQPVDREYELRARLSPLWVTDRGQILFNASLEGQTTALLVYEDRSFRVLTAGGFPSGRKGVPLQDLDVHAVTADGQILVSSIDVENHRQVEQGAMDLLEPVYVSNSAVNGVEAANGFVVTRNSLTPSGARLLRLNFRLPDDRTARNGLFRGYHRGLSDLLVQNGERLQDLSGPCSIVWMRHVIADDGTAYYVVADGARRVLYRHPPAGPRVRLLATGDTVDGREVLTFANGGGNSLGMFVSPAGSLLVGVSLQGRVAVLRFREGKDQPEIIQTSSEDVYWHNDSTGTLINANVNNQGAGLYLWKDGPPVPLIIRNRTEVDGSRVETIESAVVNAKGEVFAMVSTGQSEMTVVKVVDGQIEVLFKEGDRVLVRGIPVLTSLLQDPRTPPLKLITGGEIAGSLAEWRDGALKPLLSVGERIQGAIYRGVAYANLHSAPSGDVYLPATNGILRASASGVEMALRTPVQAGTLRTGGPYRVAVNRNGDIAWSTFYAADAQALIVSRGQEHTRILTFGVGANTQPDIFGDQIWDISQLGITGSGAVALRASMRSGSSRLILWEAGEWKVLAEQATFEWNGRRMTSQPNLRVAGDRILMHTYLDYGVLFEWKNGKWEPVLLPSDKVPTGEVLNSVSRFAWNNAGDIAVLHEPWNYNRNLVVKRAGKYHNVHSLTQLTADGDLLTAILGTQLMDDGTVYVLATNDNAQQVLYEGKPK